MADTKISQLSAATALAGTEVVPVVQGGATKKATIDQILSPAAGKGIDFSANAGATGMTSKLLDDYEEGTHVTTAVPDSGSITLNSSYNEFAYTKVGRLVTITGFIVVDSVSSPSGEVYFTLPFACAAGTPMGTGGSFRLQGTNAFTGDCFFYMNATQARVYLSYRDTNGAYQALASAIKASTVLGFSFSYNT